MSFLEEKLGKPTMTKDALTVAKDKEPLENMGGPIVREVASKPSDVTGDGSTAAAFLAQAICRVKPVR